MSDRYKSQKKYDSQNTCHFAMKLNHNTDEDIIIFLETQSNKQGAIKEALRRYMKYMQIEREDL